MSFHSSVEGIEIQRAGHVLHQKGSEGEPDERPVWGPQICVSQKGVSSPNLLSLSQRGSND